MVVIENMDLIGTIEDDAEVTNFSEDSDAEIEVVDYRNLIFYEININIFFFFIKF